MIFLSSVSAITQAWTTCSNSKKSKSPVMSCDHCPMIWYHKLCSEIEGMTNDKKVQSVILKHVAQLPEEEQVIVQTKLSGAETLGDIETKEQNELLMMLLRAHCESKQNRHVHDTAENRLVKQGEYVAVHKRIITITYEKRVDTWIKPNSDLFRFASSNLPPLKCYLKFKLRRCGIVRF